MTAENSVFSGVGVGHLPGLQPSPPFSSSRRGCLCPRSARVLWSRGDLQRGVRFVGIPSRARQTWLID